MTSPRRPDPTLFRLTAIVWAVGGLARPVMYLTDAFGFRSVSGGSLALSLVGAAVALAVAAFLWLRPGRGSAIAATAFGFSAVPSLTFIPLIGTPPWFLVLAVLGFAAFGLSIACLWTTRRRPAP